MVSFRSSTPDQFSLVVDNKIEAAHRVIDSGRTIAEVARDLGLNEGLLGKWVANQEKDIAFLKKASAGGPSLDVVLGGTLPRISRSRALRADGRGVRHHRDHPDVLTAQRCSRAVSLRRTGKPAELHRGRRRYRRRHLRG
ncbi:hypothetical protein ERC79_16035 [Rhodococcus sp. ABRD24]|nr:hypothetical protein ERC79_16035 [Rhodococcus sp. ABRD24]